MKPITFSKEETKAIIGLIQGYFEDELDQRIGDLPAQMLLDFIAAKIGPYFYNRALYDAHAVLAQKMEDAGEAVLGLERQ